MKELIEITVNQKLADSIVTNYMSAVRVGNEFAYTDEANNVGKHKGYVHSILIYCPIDEDGKKIVPIEISATSIKRLHAAILEIEAKESEEFIDI